MSRFNWSMFALLAFLAIPAELAFGFSLWFSPGWANIQRGGPQFHVIWPAGMSALGFLVLMTAAAGVSAILAATANPERKRLTFVTLLSVAVVPALAVTVWLFQSFHAYVVAVFPNGYNPQ